MMIRRLTAAVALAAAVTVAVPTAVVRAAEEVPGLKESKEQKDARMEWWREARFGMFIHWGIYAVPAGNYKGQRIERIGEWIMLNAKIPVAEYAEYAKQFNPVEFDADAWARLAKDAGMKYLVITSKHHDGFAMFHSKASPFNIVDATPFKRDVIGELAKACQKHGIKFGLYYSQAQDWHHPGGAAARGGHWDPAQDGSMDEYIDKVALPQVKEILTNYGPIAVLWWDTPVDMNRERADKLFEPVYKLQPEIITNNRLGGGYQGDTETPEQYIPPTGFPGRDFEVCMTMNDTWGYKDWDKNWKSTETLLRNLIDIASKGGNYLLNVGPTAEGVIPEPSNTSLRQIGRWMRANGDAIYGTTASPFRKNTFDGRTTVRGSTMYVHVFNWPTEGVTLTGLKTPVESAQILESGRRVRFQTGSNSDGQPTITLARPQSTDPIATVVEMELAGPPEVDNSATAIRPSEDGSFNLPASSATLGGKMKLQGEGADQHIAAWTGRRDTVMWDVLAPAEGEYEVTVEYAQEEKNAGATYAVSTTGSSVQGKVEATGSATDFKTASLGKLRLEKGVHPIMVRPVDMPRGGVMNLKSVKLVPAR